MRLTLTFLLLCAIATFSFGQINGDSPFPVDFEVLTSSAAGIYDYGTQQAAADGSSAIWGPILSETVAGEIAWGFNAAGDSLGCETITTDLTGKLAFIRRGACGFSLKVYNAQEAGAVGCIIVNHYDNAGDTGGTLFGMLGGDSIDAVVIPAIFVSRNTGEILAPAIDGGETPQGSFTVKSFYDPVSSFSYHTPLTEALEFGDYQINYVNPNSEEAVDVEVTATITDMATGTETVLTGTSNVAPLADSVIAIDGSFLPTQFGAHTITWTNNQSSETLTSGFTMTDYTYAVDDDNLTLNVGPSDQQFQDANFVYQAGSLALMDADGAQATQMSFGLANGADVFTGDPIADQIQIILYDGDADNDNTLDFAAGGAGSFNDLTPVALATYTIDGTETGDLIFVELEDLADGDGIVDLKPDGAYYITINYDGTEAGLGVAPRFTCTTDLPYLNFPTTPIFIDQLYTGWAGQTVAVRLHLAGFVDTEEVVELDAAKVSLAPNPVRDLLNVTFNLEATADEVQMIMTDVSGKIITTEQYEQVYNQSLQMNMRNLPAGTYFLSIATPEGYRVERVVKQ